MKFGSNDVLEAQRSHPWSDVPYRARISLWMVFLLWGTIAFLALGLPILVQGVCLNKTFVAIASALVRPTGGEPEYDNCLSPRSPLLAGERGRLRLFQMSLAFAGPEAAKSVEDTLSVETPEGQIAHSLLGRAYLSAGDESAAIAVWDRTDALAQLIGVGEIAFESGNYRRA